MSVNLGLLAPAATTPHLSAASISVPLRTFFEWYCYLSSTFTNMVAQSDLLESSISSNFCVLRRTIAPTFPAGLLLARLSGHHAVKTIFLGDFRDHRAFLERGVYVEHFQFRIMVERR